MQENDIELWTRNEDTRQTKPKWVLG